MQIRVNGEPIDLSRYGPYHRRRFDMTLALLRDIGGGRVIELIDEHGPSVFGLE